MSRDIFKESILLIRNNVKLFLSVCITFSLIVVACSFIFKNRYEAYAVAMVKENPLFDGNSGSLGISSLLGTSSSFTYEQEKSVFYLSSNSFLTYFSETDEVKEIFSKYSFLEDDYVFPSEFVKWDRNFRSLVFSLQWYDAEEAEILLDLLIKEINNFTKDKRSKYIDRYVDYLSNVMAENMNRQVDQALLSLYQEELRKKITIDISDEFTFEVIDYASSFPTVVFPNRVLIFALSFIFSFISTFIFLIFRKDFLNFNND